MTVTTVSNTCAVYTNLYTVLFTASHKTCNIHMAGSQDLNMYYNATVKRKTGLIEQLIQKDIPEYSIFRGQKLWA